jgi:hypothetical protein
MLRAVSDLTEWACVNNIKMIKKRELLLFSGRRKIIGKVQQDVL